MASYLVGIAVVLDFFDGFAARMLKVSSPIGKDLDSLADMVTFGVAPGMLMFKMIFHAHIMNTPLGLIPSDTGAISAAPAFIPQYISLMIPIFSAIRLAKFNNDSRQTDSFIGVPTPANAILICSFPLTFNTGLGFTGCFGTHPLQEVVINPIFLCSLSVIMSFLLIAPIPLFSLKFKKFGWKGNEIRYIFLLLCILCFALFQFFGVTVSIVLYVLMSVINNLFFKPKTS